MKKLKEKINNNKGLRIGYKICKFIIGFILTMILIVILVQKFSNNKIAIGGYRIFNVATGSMKGEYEIGDIIVIEKVTPADLKVGDNVTYLGKTGDFEGLVVTHKIMSIRKENDEYFYITKGTANDIEDPEISFSQIYGKVAYKTILFSYIGRIMTNIYAYYTLFTLVGIGASYQIVKIVFENKEDEEASDEDEEEDS